MLSPESQRVFQNLNLLLFLSSCITNHLMTGPLGNSEFFFPSNLNVSLDLVLRNIEILGKQNSLFPSGPVIKC